MGLQSTIALGSCPSVRLPGPFQLARAHTPIRKAITGPLPRGAPGVRDAQGVLCAARKSPGADLPAIERRQLLLGLASLALVSGAEQRPALADEEVAVYTDPAEGFKMSIPAGWVYGEGGLDGNKGFSGASGARRAVGWYKEDDPSTNVVVVLTTAGADYTSMGSFGTPFDFGSNLVGSMDRSYMLRQRFGRPKDEEVQIAKLLDYKEVGGAPKTYYVEYTVVRPGGDARHLYSVATLKFNGVYNRLYTVTAQCSEEAVGSNGGMLERVVKSFAPPQL